MARINQVIIIVGDRGTGKTTYLKGDPSIQIPGILYSIQQKDPEKKILVVDTFDNPVWRHFKAIQPHELHKWKTGPVRCWSSDTNLLLDLISKVIYNAVVIFEDATKFIPSRLTKETKQFILDSKQKNLDIFFIFHYLMAIPNDLSRISDIMVIFKTKEIFTQSLRAKFPNPAIEQTFLQVQKHKSWYYCKAIKISG